MRTGSTLFPPLAKGLLFDAPPLRRSPTLFPALRRGSCSMLRPCEGAPQRCPPGAFVPSPGAAFAELVADVDETDGNPSSPSGRPVRSCARRTFVLPCSNHPGQETAPV